jgi:hypothetical protein
VLVEVAASPVPLRPTPLQPAAMTASTQMNALLSAAAQRVLKLPISPTPFVCRNPRQCEARQTLGTREAEDDETPRRQPRYLFKAVCFETGGFASPPVDGFAHTAQLHHSNKRAMNSCLSRAVQRVSTSRQILLPASSGAVTHESAGCCDALLIARTAQRARDHSVRRRSPREVDILPPWKFQQQSLRLPAPLPSRRTRTQPIRAETKACDC